MQTPPIIRIFITGALLLLLTLSCEENITYELLSGQLTGSIILVDDSGKVPDDKSGAEITLEGSDPPMKVLTDIDGLFTFDNVQSGTYNILYRKEGYTFHRMNGFLFVGGGELPIRLSAAEISQKLDVRIDSLEITGQRGRRIYLYAKLTLPENLPFIKCRLYLSNSPEVSFDNYISTQNYQIHSTYPYLDKTYVLDTFQFPAGSEIFMKCYPSGDLYYDLGYVDMNSGIYIYSSVFKDSPSNVASYVVTKEEY